MFAAHLHTHSCYSFMKGIATPEEIVSFASKFGYKYVALTDLNGLYGVYQFYVSCKEHGIKPIIGAELTFKHGSITVIAKDFEGYSSLCSLITDAQLSVSYGETPVFSIDKIKKYKNGLIVFTGRSLFNLVKSGNINKAKILLAEFKNLTNNVFVELFMHSRQDYFVCKQLTELADIYSISTVCSNDVLFLQEKDLNIQHVISASGHLTSFDRDNPDKANSMQYFKTQNEMAEQFEDFPRALANVEYIAKKVNIVLPTDIFLFPKIDFTDTSDEYTCLWNAAYKGLLKRYKPLTQEAVDRLNYEISVIHKMGYSGYFLIVYDIVNYAKEHDIPVVGRGSAGDSLVSYCLGITEVDPILHNLYFERFLHLERKSPPDIDLDLCWKNRDKVIDYIFEKYGKDKCAMICTYVTFQSRSSFRDVAKAFGLPVSEINVLTKMLPSYGGLDKLEERMKQISETSSFPLQEQKVKEIVEIGKRLTDLPRHVSVHPCGLVISPDEIYKRVPLQKAAKGIVVTQFDMKSAEKAGLLKIDLLGVRGLSVFYDTFRLLKEQGIELSLDIIPLDDVDTFNMIGKGETIGCFQIESPAMRGLLRNLKPKHVEGIIQAVAHIRPGPTSGGLKDAFIRRFNGLEETEHIHPRLEPVLKETFGVVVYQEQVLKIASIVAGLSMAESEAIRRSMTKFKGRAGMEKNRDRFISGAIKNGFDEATAVDIWNQIVGFAQYGFNKAHSATYGYLGYKSAFLKRHYPREFMAAVLMNHGGFYSRVVYAEEARRLQISLLHPDVHKSLKDFSLTSKGIMVGFLNVKGVSKNTAEKIISERLKGDFFSIFDFVSRIKPHINELENLIKCNAFSFTGLKKTEQILIGRMALKGVDYSSYRADIGFSLSENIINELKLLDMAVSGHPLKMLSSIPKCVKISELFNFVGKNVHVCGFVATYRRVVTKNKNYMKFVSVMDETGIIECVLFSGVYKKYGHLTDRGGLITVYGKVENDFDKITIDVKYICRIANDNKKDAI